MRQERNWPILAEVEPWLHEKLGLISQKTELAEAIRYTLSRWGVYAIDSNTVERSIRPIASTARTHSSQVPTATLSTAPSLPR